MRTGTDIHLLDCLPVRSLRKILLLHQHVKTLCRIPRSPKRKHLLFKRLVIIPHRNPPIPYNLDLPDALPAEIYANVFLDSASCSFDEQKVVEELTSWQDKAIETLTPKS